MSDPEPVTIHAARRDRNGNLWFQYDRDLDRWRNAHGSLTFAELERLQGPTVPVRIVTTDPGDAERLRVAERERDSLARRLNERWGQLEEARAEIRQLRGEAGLSTDQHIHDRALGHAIRWFAGDDASDEVDYVLSVAVKFADLIRDGQVPNA